jgi:hypothetical protein
MPTWTMARSAPHHHVLELLIALILALLLVLLAGESPLAGVTG